MNINNNMKIGIITAVSVIALFVLSLLITQAPATDNPAAKFGILTLLPPIVAISLAFITKETILSLFVGVFIGEFMLCVNDLNIVSSAVNAFLAIGLLRSSGILDFIIKIISPITNILKIPSQILPLAMLRPISGSASMAVATDIMKANGVDTLIGKIASTIMGSTETTLYTIAIYTGVVKIKKTRFILLAALIGDIVRNDSICRNMEIYVVKILLTFLGNSCRMKT